MSWDVQDIFLGATVLASAYYAYLTIPDTLNHIRNLAAGPEQSSASPRKQLQKDAENAIGIETLRVLSDGPSYDLRASTIKIVASRTLKSRTKKLLLKDLASTDEHRRYSAMNAIWLLIFNPALQGRNYMDDFLDYPSFYALITALKNVLVDHHPDMPLKVLQRGHHLYPEPQLPPSPVRPPVRPSHEASLILLLRLFLNTVRPYRKQSDYPDNVSCALAAGLVTRWLKDYPFPCARPQNARFNYKKSDVAGLFEKQAWWSDDEDMARIFEKINATAMGKKQLRDAGLRGSSYTEVDDVAHIVNRWKHVAPRLDDDNGDVRMINGEDTAGATTPPLPPPPIAFRRLLSGQHGSGRELPRVRSHELSPEEESLRRRRREAVVVAESDAPFSQDNILQRTESGSAWRRTSHDDTARVEGDFSTGRLSSVVWSDQEQEQQGRQQ